MRNFISTPQGLIAIIDAPLVPIFLLVVFLMSPWLGLVMTIAMISLFAMAWVAEKSSVPLSKVAVAQAQSAQRRLADLAQGGDVLTAHGMNRRAYDYWQNLQRPSMALASRASVRTIDFSSVAKGIRLMLQVSLTCVGGYLAMTDQITVGAMIASNILGSRGLAPIELLIGATRQLSGAWLSWQRIEKLLNVQPPQAMTRLPPPRGAIDVERVVYAPPGSTRTTIKGISFRLEPGTFLGLVGPSAAGKSTLGRLLCGVWVAQSGIVRLDGADLQVWNREDFGRSCGYLPQDVQLFDGTVRENICRFSETSDEEVIAAAMAAGAHEFIVKLPQGYETPAGVGGTALSAGQRQRIGLARALFGNPQLVVLDEPNANLDSEGEEALIQSLARLKSRGATTIVISHRPAVMAVADMIAVLVEGQLQQLGPRQEVLKRIQGPRPAVDQHVA